MVFLVSCKDDFEAQILMGLLASANIPVEKKYRGVGQYLKVFGGLGRDVDLYVPDDRLEEALQLLDSDFDWEEE